MSEKYGNILTFSEPSDKLRDIGHFRSARRVFMSFRRLRRGRLILILTGSAEHRVEGRLRKRRRGPVGRDFEPGKGVWRKRRNEKAVKPLKIHKTAKSLIQWS
jgi:hypothetical protein